MDTSRKSPSQPAEKKPKLEQPPPLPRIARAQQKESYMQAIAEGAKKLAGCDEAELEFRRTERERDREERDRQRADQAAKEKRNREDQLAKEMQDRGDRLARE